MRPNRLRAILAGGRPAYGTMIQEMTSTVVPVLLANAGFDFAFIDMEHGPFSLESATELIRTLRLTGMTPLVRVPDGQYHLIARVMDAGAEGFMTPRVEKREQVEYVVQCAKYPPVGKRGCSIMKGHNDFHKAELHEFTTRMNAENLVILQIERKEAVEHIDDLLDVPGVDAIIFGPKDLALSLGRPESFADAVTQAAMEKVLRACQARGITVGLHTANIHALHEWQRKGAQLLMWSSDIELFATAAEEGLGRLKGMGRSNE